MHITSCGKLTGKLTPLRGPVTGGIDSALVWNTKSWGRKEAGYRARAVGRPIPGYLGISPDMGHISPKSTGKGTLSYTEICVCMVATV